MPASDLFLFSAPSPPALINRLAQFRAQISTSPNRPLGAWAADLAAAPRHRTRLALVADDIDSLHDAMDRAGAALHEPSGRKTRIAPGVFYAEQPAEGKTALLFPGIGSAYDGMLAELTEVFPEVRRWFNDMDTLLTTVEPILTENKQGPKLLPENGLPNFIGAMAIFSLIERAGVRYEALAGHSNGENVALVASGKMAYHRREDLMLMLRDVVQASVQDHAGEYARGMTLAVSGLPYTELEKLCRESDGGMVVAMVNCPTQVVLFVVKKYADRARTLITAAGGLYVQLPLREPLHTPFFRPAMPRLAKIYDAMRFEPGACSVYSCSTAQRFPNDAGEARAVALRQWISQVRFQAMLEQLYADGIRTFVEVGPGSVLTGFVTDTLRARGEFLALATDNPRRPGLRHFLETLGQLFVHGQDLAPVYLFRTHPQPVAPVDIAQPAPIQASALPHTPVQAPNQTPRQLPPPAPQPTAAPRTQTTTAPAPPHVTMPAAAWPTAGMPGLDTATRATLLESHFALMQEFLGSQARTMSALHQALATPATVAHERAAPVDPATVVLPMLGAVPAVKGDSTTLTHTVDVSRELMLVDHALANQNARTPAGMTPLPLIPFAVSMEFMAEAALTLRPGWFVSRLEGLRSYRWLALDQGVLPLQLQVRCVEQTHESATMAVQLSMVADGELMLAVEGNVHLRATSPAHLPEATVHVDGRPPMLPFSEFYARHLFHGPRFQGIYTVHAVADDGIEVVMEVDTEHAYLADAAQPDFVLPVVFLDCVGQATAYILYERAHKQFALFPYQIESFEQFAPDLAQTRRIVARSHAELKEAIVTTALEFLDDAGRVLGRVQNFHQRYFEDPQVAQFIAPQNHDLFHTTPLSLNDDTVTACMTTGFSTELFAMSNGIWLRVLAGQVLAPSELATWHALPKRGPRRQHWLLGRVAAKDAIRRWAHAEHDVLLMPWQIVIANQPTGQPAVESIALVQLDSMPTLSISHSHDRAVAAVCPTPTRVGIDMEFAEGRDAAVLTSILGSGERAMLEQTGGVDLTGVLFFWCAKEAAAKASGLAKGIVPHAWRITAYAPPTTEQRGHATVVNAGRQFAVTLWHENKAHLALCHLDDFDQEST